MAASAGRVLLIPEGTYNAATTYNMLDIVYYDGATYVCKQTSLGNLPTDTDYWQLMCSSSGTAAQVSFAPTGTGLVATNVQNAVVEVRNNISNPNLLINPWFTVNQSGFTSGSGDGPTYFVDGWMFRRASACSVTSSGISITGTGSANGSGLNYTFDANVFEIGKTYTITLMNSNDVMSLTFTYTTDTMTHHTGNAFDGHSVDIVTGLYNGHQYLYVLVFDTNPFNLRAIKLEKGNISTLALDTAPDYTTELLKCQRYYWKPDDLYVVGAAASNVAMNGSLVMFPVKMRTTPTVTYSNAQYFNGSWTDATSIAAFRTTADGAGASISGSFTANTALMMKYNAEFNARL